jgi:hypothetical protein
VDSDRSNDQARQWAPISTRRSGALALSLDTFVALCLFLVLLGFGAGVLGFLLFISLTLLSLPLVAEVIASGDAPGGFPFASSSAPTGSTPSIW